MRRLSVLSEGHAILPVLRALSNGQGKTAPQLAEAIIADIEFKTGVVYTERERYQITKSVGNIAYHRSTNNAGLFFEFDTTKRPYIYSITDDGQALLNSRDGVIGLGLLDTAQFENYDYYVRSLELAKRKPSNKVASQGERVDVQSGYECNSDNYVYSLRAKAVKPTLWQRVLMFFGLTV